MQEVINKIKRFTPKKILVIGDLMLDQYTIGSCSRVSPEAPTLVLEVKEEKYNPGGAGNTAVNLKTLGSEPILIGIVGTDYWGEIFKKDLEDKKIAHSGVLFSPDTKTIRKERLFAGGQQAGPRIDHNDCILENESHESYILGKFLESVDSSDIVVISDYIKGTLSEKLIKDIVSLSIKKNKQVLIDPRQEHVEAYKNASFITPNFKEACEITGLKLEFSQDNARKLAKALHEKTNSSVVLKMSDNGILYYDGNHFDYYPTFKREVRDVSGAGDTVMAALAVSLANGLNIREAVYIANHAGGVKVEKSGVQPVSFLEIIEDIKSHNNLMLTF